MDPGAFDLDQRVRLAAFDFLTLQAQHTPDGVLPLLIRALVDAGGTTTLRQLAHVFLAQDESQLRCCEKRIKEMP